MRVLLAGYVPLEGRMSMMRTARSIHDAMKAQLQPEDSVQLSERRGEPTSASHRLRGARVKLRKRLLHPARLWRPGYDVLHLVDNDYAVGVPPWQWRRTVVTVHDLMPFLIAPRLEEVFSGAMGLWFYRRGLHNLARAGRVVCVSSFTRTCLLEHTGVDPARVCVVPQGVGECFQPMVDDDPALDTFRKRHGLTGRRVVLHVGSCAPYKQIDALLAIVARLRSRGMHDVCLLKVGGLFNTTQQQFIEAHGLRDHLVHLHGLDDTELTIACNAAHVVLWPSLFEGFGLPVLEAMACGTPVVCSTGGALDETAGHAALKHDPADWEAMEASCNRVLEDPACAADLRARGLAWSAGFSWQKTAQNYLEIYRELMKESIHATH
jgi:glycosyltransferase involved in cell wall biosynthesis